MQKCANIAVSIFYKNTPNLKFGNAKASVLGAEKGQVLGTLKLIGICNMRELDKYVFHGKINIIFISLRIS